MVRVAGAAILVSVAAGAAPALSSSFSVSRHVGVSLHRVWMKPGAHGRHRVVRSVPLRVADPAAYRRAKAAADEGYRRWSRDHRAAADTPGAKPWTHIAGGLNHAGLAASEQNVLDTPPDPTGAAGPSDYVEMVNSELAVYSKSDLSAPTETMYEGNFVGAPDDLPCDGNIEWDQQGGRWLYSVVSCDDEQAHGTLYFGWSKTSSPALTPSNWCQYAENTGQTFDDYPKLGHDDSQIIIGFNAFGASGIESDIMVLDKPANGDTSCPDIATEQSTAAVLTVGGLVTGGAWTPVAVNLADSSPVGYAVAISLDQEHLHLYTIGRDDEQANVLLDDQTISVPGFCFPPTAPQKGSKHTLETMDTRLTQAVGVTDPNTGHEGIWTQHTVAAECDHHTPSGPSAVQWYELEPGASTPTQVGMVRGPHGSFAWMGAISPSSDGQNAAIFYNTSSKRRLPDFRVRARHLSTNPGQMIEGLVLATSTSRDEDHSCFYGFDAPCRWGDYSGASPDPSSAGLIWGTGEFTAVSVRSNHDPQWGSENAAIDVTPAANYGLTAHVTGVRSGTGSVSSSPDGILSCASTCSHDYPYGVPVQLTATPGPDSVFRGWSGDCSGKGVCTVPMGGPQNVRATFAPQPEKLSYVKAGRGSGRVISTPDGLSCHRSCARAFDIGTPVKLVATAGFGSVFMGWSGDCSGTRACRVTMDSAKSVTATFAKLTCVVPDVVGKTFAAAARAIKRAKCAVGAVTTEPSPLRRGRVISQSPAAGKHRPFRTRVNLVVSAGT